MFKLSNNRTAQWPVTLSIPHEDGKVKELKFMATINRLTNAEIEQKDAEIDSRSTLSDLEKMAAVWMKWLAGWTLKDVNGEPIPCTQEALTALFDTPDGTSLITGIAKAVGEVRNGAKAKN